MLSAKEYQKLVDVYVADTAFLSYHVYSHPSYQKLLSEGESIIPFLLRDLVTNNAHWLQLVLLCDIVQPVLAEDIAGDFYAIRDCMLDWAGKTKYANYLVLM
jgi:hypothetical protein